MHPQGSKMHKQMHENEDIFVKQAQGFSLRLFYFALWHGGQTYDKGGKTSFYRWIVVDKFMKNGYNYIVRKVRNSLLGKEAFVWN